MRNPFIFSSSGKVNTFDLIKFSYMLFNDKNYLLKSPDFIKHFQQNKNMYSYLLAYVVMYRYAMAEYTVEELLNIFNILRFDYSDIDIINLNNDTYWLEKILLADIKNYFSDNFNNFLNILIRESEK